MSQEAPQTESTHSPRNPKTPTALTILTVTQAKMGGQENVVSLKIRGKYSRTFKLVNTSCIVNQVCVSSTKAFQWIEDFSKDHTEDHDQKEDDVCYKTFVQTRAIPAGFLYMWR